MKGHFTKDTSVLISKYQTLNIEPTEIEGLVKVHAGFIGTYPEEMVVIEEQSNLTQRKTTDD